MTVLGAILSVAFLVALVGFPLLLILYAAGKYPRWRKRSLEERKRRRDRPWE